MAIKSLEKIKLLDTEVSFELIKVPKKRSVSILISPTGLITVKSPKNLSTEKLSEILKIKSGWILGKLNYFKKMDVVKEVKEFKEGESHMYLGNKYKLKIKQSSENHVHIENEYLIVETTNHENEVAIKKILSDWYWKQAKEIFENEFEDQFLIFSKRKLKKPILTVERLTKKWGQCGSNGHIKLNKDLIKMPIECIRYVIVHEICHLIEHNHSKNFYKLLETYFPDWKACKSKLHVLSYSL